MTSKELKELSIDDLKSIADNVVSRISNLEMPRFVRTRNDMVKQHGLVMKELAQRAVDGIIVVPTMQIPVSK